MRTPDITKGTVVRVTTTNGGDCVCILALNYYNTYPATLDINGRILVLTGGSIGRLKTIEPHEYPIGA